MAQLLLSLIFLAIMAVAMKSIAHDLTRPLVMQPWGDADGLIVPQASVAAPVLVPSEPRAVTARRPHPAPAYALALAA